jgi:hypothetical protein
MELFSESAQIAHHIVKKKEAIYKMLDIVANKLSHLHTTHTHRLPPAAASFHRLSSSMMQLINSLASHSFFRDKLPSYVS